MTIQIVYGTDGRDFAKVFRKVYQGKNLAKHKEDFFGLRDTYQYGVMTQLKGKERIILAKFGERG